MTFRAWALAGGLALGMFTMSAQPAQAGETEKEKKVAAFSELYGEWKAGDDPKGEIKNDPVYAKSKYILSAEKAVYQQDDGPLKIGGAYDILQWSRDGGAIEVDIYGEKLQLNFRVRRGDNGAIEGFVLSETPEKIQVRYYTK